MHFEEKKYTSYRIKIKGDEKLFGLNGYSLIKPRTKNYIHEWLYHELVGEGGLIKTKYDFIKVSLNGENFGLYAIQEEIGKILLERNKKREGPIFGIREEYSRNFNDIKLRVYNKKKWETSDNIEFTKNITEKLEGFFSNLFDERDFSEMIDQEKWAWFFAVHDINNYNHGGAVKSVKFYYNPISGKFEPISLDGHRETKNFSKHYNWEETVTKKGISTFDRASSCENNKYIKCNLLLKRFFYASNGKLRKDFYEKYRQSVLKISSKTFLDEFFEKRKKKINLINSKIYSDYFLIDHTFSYGPGLYYFDKVDFYKKAAILKKYFKSEPEKLFASQVKFKINFNNISINNDYVIKNIKCLDDEKNEITLNVNREIKKKLTIINLNDFSNISLKCNQLNLKNNLSNKSIKIKVDHLNSIEKDQNYFEYKKNKSLSLQKYKKKFRSTNKKLFLNKDEVVIDENIYIPEGYDVVIKPGQKIFLADGAIIYSKSPWNAIGNDKNEIIIEGTKSNLGGGIIISDTKKVSYFKNVKFKYLDGFQEKIKPSKDYIILGSINFYKAEINLENVSFEKISSEDAINIMNSKFIIRNINFNEIKSDAIDFDFSNGIIQNATFYNVGNDAIDFSGSKAEIQGAIFDNIQDKIISVGENSNIKISNITATNSFVGIAAKDGSIVSAKNITTNNVKIVFASFIKKKEYNEPILMLKNIDVQNSIEKWLVDDKSKIMYENSTVGKISKNIIPIIYDKKTNLIK